MATGIATHAARPGRGRTIRIVVVAVVGVVAVGGAVAWRALTRQPDPVEVDALVEQFREGVDAATTVAGTALAPTSAAPAGPAPAPGVYRYATVGSESLEGVLDQTHTYPAESGITVTASDCGVALAWVPLDNRSDTWVRCTTDAGLVELRDEQRHGFFGADDRRTFTCDPPFAILPAGASAGATWEGTCSSGDVAGTRHGRVVGPEDVTVAGAAVATVHVEVTEEVTGASTGTARYDYWVRPTDGLLVRFSQHVETTNRSLVGNVHYAEDVTLTLVSLEPER